LLHGEDAGPAEKPLVAWRIVLHRAKGRDVLQIHAVGPDLLRGKHRTPYVTCGPPRWVPDPFEWGPD
jgi:hypothetical protein